MPSLQVLDLSYNNLKEFNQTFATNLTTLIMANNKLNTISWEYLKDLPNLSQLDIRYNNMTKLNQSVFHKVEEGMELMVQGTFKSTFFTRKFLKFFVSNTSRKPLGL